MTTYNEFHAHLQKGQIQEAIALVVSQLVELDVVTQLPTATAASPQPLLRTKIDLLGGRITNEISPEVVENTAYSKYLDFHNSQIQASSHLIQGQLNSLRLLAGQVDQDSGGLAGAPIPPDNRPIASPVLPAPPIGSQEVEDMADSDFPAAKQADLLVSTIAETPATIVPAKLPEPVLPTTTVIPQAPEPDLQVAAPPVTPEPSTPDTAKVAAAIAQAKPVDLSEASAIPNKFTQALRSAGIQAEATGEELPFAAPAEPVPPATAAPVPLDPELVDLLNNSQNDEDWDQWLLGEDAIFSELSANTPVTDFAISDEDDSWLAASQAFEDDQAPWEGFAPEYAQPRSASGGDSSNAERLRQNLANDPDLMDELLADLESLQPSSEAPPPPQN